jgi:hypothetical protein
LSRLYSYLLTSENVNTRTKARVQADHQPKLPLRRLIAQNGIAEDLLKEKLQALQLRRANATMQNARMVLQSIFFFQ